MFRRFVPMLLATVVAGVLIPATAAEARCAPDHPGYRACVATCAVYSALELAYC